MSINDKTQRFGMINSLDNLVINFEFYDSSSSLHFGRGSRELRRGSRVTSRGSRVTSRGSKNLKIKKKNLNKKIKIRNR